MLTSDVPHFWGVKSRFRLSADHGTTLSRILLGAYYRMIFLTLQRLSNAVQPFHAFRYRHYDHCHIVNHANCS